MQLPLIDLSTCQKKTFYFKKDCLKFQTATKLISRGSSNSCSHAYATAAGKLANTGSYCQPDVVGISAEGKRNGRVSPDYQEIHKAIESNVQMFITDKASVRNSNYNIGEQKVAQFLQKNEYMESTNGDGQWTRKRKADKSEPTTFELESSKKLKIDSFIDKDTSKYINILEKVVVNEIVGDLLYPPFESIIVQQCNTICVKPHGLSESIGKTFPYANIYSFRHSVDNKRNLAVKQDRPKLGTCLLSFPPLSSTISFHTKRYQPIVANLFAQYTPGAPIKRYRLFDEDGQTELIDTTEQRKQWFQMSLTHLKSQLEACQNIINGISIWFPYKIGCGLACSKQLSESQWQEYKNMIFKFAQQCPFVNVSIVCQE
jgi:hypothetical protein